MSAITIRYSLCAVACVLLLLSGTALAAESEFLTSVDSIWVSEETDCDGENIVEICYELSGLDTATVDIQICHLTGDSVWYGLDDPYFSTFEDEEGDFGDGVLSGTHCFFWDMGTDWPDVEGLFDIRITTSGGCCGGEPVRDNGSIIDFALVGRFSGYDIILDPTVEYLPGDSFFGKVWLADTTLPDTVVGACDDYPAFMNLGDWYDGRHTGAVFYIHYYICSPFDTNLVMHFFADDDAVIFDDGVVIHSDLSGSSVHCVYTDIDIHFDACEAKSIYFWVYNQGGAFMISHGYENPDGSPATFLEHSIYPMTGETSSFDVIVPLDSRPPNIALDCTIIGGSVFYAEWESDDMFPYGGPVEVVINDGVTSYSDMTTDDHYFHVLSDGTDFGSIVVSVRDSFCNVAVDSCYARDCYEPDIAVCPVEFGFSSCAVQPILYTLYHPSTDYIVEDLLIRCRIFPVFGPPSLMTFNILSPELAVDNFPDSTLILFSGYSAGEGDSVVVTLESVTDSSGCIFVP